MKFGENLKKLRKSQNISQEELADKVGVSRQSVSKWETGEAYPEMNNILQLCKIFKCEINSLVNDNMVDLSALDEDVKMSVVKFKEDKQKKMKGLSKAIYIIARITKVVTIIGFIAVIIAMIAVPIVGFNVSAKNNTLTVFGEKFNYEKGDYTVSLTYKDKSEVINGRDEVEALNNVLNYLETNNIPRVAICFEIVLLLIEVSLVFAYYAFNHLDNLFTNIHGGDTPFTLENVNHIKKLAYLLIIITVIPLVASIFTNLLIESDLGVNFGLTNIVFILIVFSLSYIFEYGYQIQLDSNGKMYGDSNE